MRHASFLTHRQKQAILDLAQRFGPPADIYQAFRPGDVCVYFPPSASHRDGSTWLIPPGGKIDRVDES